MSEVVKFSIPSIIIIVVVETDIDDAENRLRRFSMKILRTFFFDDDTVVVRDELLRETWREDAEEEEMRFARPTPIWCFFKTRARERSEREVIRVLKMRENSPRRKDTMDKI